MKYLGQYNEKEDGPTAVVKAGCNNQLWFWHCVFGYVGSMNDINIWMEHLGQMTLLMKLEENSFISCGFWLMEFTQSCHDT
jgi:hypothetical protein